MPTETKPQSALDLANEEAIRSLLARANLLRMREQWNDAIAACTEAIRRAPRSASAHSLLGEIYEAQGKYDDAVQWFGMALEIDPTNAGDRVHWERLTELQRVRLRTQDIAAQLTHPPIPKEKTLEWIDRVFPPGRSDSLPRLILAMSLTFAVLIAVCGGFIYFYVVPHHPATRVSEDNSVNLEGTLPPNLSLPSPPVVMTPSGGAGGSSPTNASDTAALGRANDAKNVPPPHVHEKAAETTAPTVVDIATLRQRLAPLLNNTQTQLVDLTPGQDGTLYLDLALLPTGTEATERLREQALRAASQSAHAIAGLVPGDTPRVVVRVARLALTATGPVAASGTRAKDYQMVLQAEAPLRYFRDADVAALTPSDLIARFRNVQWFAGSSSSPGLPSITSGTTGNADNAPAAPVSSPAPASGAAQTTGSGTLGSGNSGAAGASGAP